MIKLNHLENCHAILKLNNKINLNQSLRFVTDTRKYIHPSAFVAIPGSKINPIDVMNDLLSQECPLVIYQKSAENDKKVLVLQAKHTKTIFIPVTDSVIFLQELANEHIKEWKKRSTRNTIFSISGSNGKTTHKEMLSFILKSVMPDKIVATEKNNNNHLGVPLTLLEVTERTEFVVLELGSNHPGEIKVLCDIALANAGLTTNIGATHLEFFGSEQKVFEEEGYLYHAVKEVTNGKGFYLINMDDSFLKTLTPTEGSVTYGENKLAEAQIKFLENGATINYKGQNLKAENSHITGKHNKLNLITCVFIAHHFYPELKEQLIESAKNFKPTKNRSEWIEFENRSVFLDAYNANPSSMKAALQGFKEALKEHGLKLDEACIVLGDMNELGDSASQYHEDVGRYIKELGFTNVYFIGRYAPFYIKGHLGGEARMSSAEFKQEYRTTCLKKFPIHFIKGSRSLQLESLFDIR